nr:hypothetical protein [Fodinibius sp.]
MSDESIAWLTSQQIDPGRTVLARQVHGADVMYATEPGIYNQPDGFFTDKSGIHLIIRTADCAAVLVSIVEIPAV